MKFIFGGVLAAVAVIAVSVRGAEVYAVRPIEGYKCMKLKVTEAEAMDFSGASRIWILKDPQAGAPHIVSASAVVLVKTPEHLVDGFAEVLTINGKPGWIEADRLKPYDPNARCIPSLLSNGYYSGG
jgi:hypothetical protein